MKLFELIRQLERLEHSPNVNVEVVVEVEGERRTIETVAVETHEDGALRVRLYLEGQPMIV